MIIIVTGTPCTGKTSLAKAIAKKQGFTYLDANEIIDNNNLKESYDKERDTYVVDEEKLVRLLVEEINKGKDLVIDSHMSHEVPATMVDKCIVTKCDIKELRKRLESRNYSEDKVKENLDAEIFDVCFNEATENGHKVTTIDTTNKSPEELTNEIC